MGTTVHAAPSERVYQVADEIEAIIMDRANSEEFAALRERATNLDPMQREEESEEIREQMRKLRPETGNRDPGKKALYELMEMRVKLEILSPKKIDAFI